MKKQKNKFNRKFNLKIKRKSKNLRAKANKQLIKYQNKLQKLLLLLIKKFSKIKRPILYKKTNNKMQLII